MQCLSELFEPSFSEIFPDALEVEVPTNAVLNFLSACDEISLNTVSALEVEVPTNAVFNCLSAHDEISLCTVSLLEDEGLLRDTPV